jgi:hypothetical protein
MPKTLPVVYAVPRNVVFPVAYSVAGGQTFAEAWDYSGALHYLPLDDNDDLGTSNATLTLTGTEQRRPTRFGSGFDFNGASRLTFPSTLNTTAPYAIFFAVTFRGLANTQIVINRSGQDFYVRYDASLKLVFGFYNAAGAVVERTPSPLLLRGPTYRIGFGYDGSQCWISYDGIVVDTFTPASLKSTPANPIRLGGPMDFSGTPFGNFFTGVISELVIYQSALTAEPADYWNSGLGTKAGYKVAFKPAVTGPNENVIISAGQSNGQIGENDWASQSATWPPSLGVDDRAAFAGSDGTNSTNGWETLAFRSYQTGPAYSYLKQLVELGVPAVHGISRNISGLAIAGWDNGAPNWTNLLSMVSDRMADLADPVIKAVVWNQGESDAANTTLANAYEAKLESLISRMRAEWGADLPFVIVIPDLTGAGLSLWPEIETVRTAIQTVAAADANVYTVDSRGYSRPEDGIHVSQADQIIIGRQIAEIIATLI